VYAARKKMKCLVLACNIGGQAAWSGDIENYTGYQFVTGAELADKFEEHIKKYDIEVRENEEVTDVRKDGDVILIKSLKGEYTARAAVVASGKRSKELGVPGEEEFKHKGITYCATCDGPVFAGKDVVVVGGGNSALDAALQLTKIANKIYLVNNTPKLGGDAIIREKVVSADNVTVMNDSQVTAISGDTFVSGIEIKTDSDEKEFQVQGVFVEVGLIPNADFVEDVDKNERGEIKVNCCNETSIPGIFAAGDVTDVPEKQIIIAAGDGAKATLSAFKYLARRKDN
jgi:alkyl hydroperoxide reductase subunit F